MFPNEFTKESEDEWKSSRVVPVCGTLEGMTDDELERRRKAKAGAPVDAPEKSTRLTRSKRDTQPMSPEDVTQGEIVMLRDQMTGAEFYCKLHEQLTGACGAELTPPNQGWCAEIRLSMGTKGGYTRERAIAKLQQLARSFGNADLGDRTEHEVCRGCRQEIDVTVCGCGTGYSDHESAFVSGHAFIPLGCECLMTTPPKRGA